MYKTILYGLVPNIKTSCCITALTVENEQLTNYHKTNYNVYMVQVSDHEMVSKILNSDTNGYFIIHSNDTFTFKNPHENWFSYKTKYIRGHVFIINKQKLIYEMHQSFVTEYSHKMNKLQKQNVSDIFENIATLNETVKTSEDKVIKAKIMSNLFLLNYNKIDINSILKYNFKYVYITPDYPYYASNDEFQVIETQDLIEYNKKQIIKWNDNYTSEYIYKVIKDIFSYVLPFTPTVLLLFKYI